MIFLRRYGLLALWIYMVCYSVIVRNEPGPWGTAITNTPRLWTLIIRSWVETGCVSLVLYAILQPAHARLSWKRLGVAFVALVIYGYGSLLFHITDQPPVFYVREKFVGLSMLLLLVVAIGMLYSTLSNRYRQRAR